MIRTPLSALALALCFTPVAFAHGGALELTQTNAPAPEIKADDLGDGLFMMTGRGGNIGVLTGEDGVFVIDSQFPDIAPANLAKIQEVTGGAPTFLVNTHWHGDHTGGNAAFGGTIIAHDNVRARVSTEQTLNRAGQISTTPPSPEAAWPIITFAEGLSLHLNEQTIRVFHVPTAHTDGDAMVYFEEANVLHMGDTFFSGRFPFIDIGSGGSVDGFIAAMELAYEEVNEETRIIPGHGPLSSRADLATNIQMLKDVKAAISSAIEKGLSLEETVAAGTLDPWAEAWGWSFINAQTFTAIVYTDLASSGG